MFLPGGKPGFHNNDGWDSQRYILSLYLFYDSGVLYTNFIVVQLF